MRSVGLLLRHLPSGGFQGQASDIEIHAREFGLIDEVVASRPVPDAAAEAAASRSP